MKVALGVILLGLMVVSCSDKPTEPVEQPTLIGAWQAEFTIVYESCLVEPATPPETVAYTSVVTFGADSMVSVVVDPPCWGSTEQRCRFGAEPFTSFRGQYWIDGEWLRIRRDASVPEHIEDYTLRLTDDSLRLAPHQPIPDPPMPVAYRSTSVVWGDAFMKTPPFKRIR